MLSGVFVVIANAWMNAPTGLRWVDGRAVDIDPVAAMMNPAAFPQVLHMTLAAYAATGLVVAGIHALPLLRHPRNAFHRRALSVALLIGAPAALLQPVSGDLSARFVAHWQPVKLAAMEGHFKTERGAPLRIGGWPDEAAGETRWAIEIPYGLSLLAFKDPRAEVKGLEAFPRQDWPPVAIVHVAFQIMVALGSFMALVSAAALWLMWRRRELTRHRWLLRALVLAAPMGFICTEAGWIVTEVGRQPWIIHGLMRTAEAVTPMPGLVVPFLVFTGLYVVLGLVVASLLYQQVLRSPQTTEEDAA
jgi:cytochrome d ubiquinol oxidase subunit I